MKKNILKKLLAPVSRALLLPRPAAKSPQRRTAGRLALAGAALTLLAATAPVVQAQAWPSKPIRIVVNFPPGGAADVIARAVAVPLGEKLGQSVIVENRAGANGNIGGEVVAQAANDGYTFLMSSAGVSSINPQLYPKMSFDPQKDLTPVAAAARVLVFLESRATLPVKDFQEFVAYLKANPGKLSFGTPGNGSSPHLAAEMLKGMTGTYAIHVPYRGAAPALTDLMAGQIDFMFDPGPGLAQVRAGKLKLLAVGSMKRTPLFPQTPTLHELGLKGFDADSLFGFYAPAGTSAEIVRRMNAEINAILATPAVSQRVADLGGEVAPMTPAQFAERIAGDSVRFGKLIRDRGIKAE
jgi:tripartite-type tricarboxylate transporter receptor subunit TctC